MVPDDSCGIMESMAQHAVEYPEEHIFCPGMSPVKERAELRGMVWTTMCKTVLKPSLVERVLYFLCPERIWLSHLPVHCRRTIRYECREVRQHLHNGQTVSGKVGLPVTLFFGSPGSWTEHLPQFKIKEKEHDLDHLCIAHRAEEFALLMLWLARYGGALRTLRAALDLREETSNRAAGAAALLFALLARGELARLNSLTLIHAGGGGPAGSSFLAPLARPGAVALDRLRTLHLSMAEPRIPLRHLAQLARRGGLRNLQVLALAGPAVAEDADVAALLRPLLRNNNVLMSIDLRGTNAGVHTLDALLDALEGSRARKLSTVLLEDASGEAAPETAAKRRKMEELLRQDDTASG
mmetsp:Transcript_41948/g.96268  ORF Transcript_41948/g.96268 Transcript_41948/m.96268 type:complete len:353 (+) Transcript_41948:115-1173(+)